MAIKCKSSDAGSLDILLLCLIYRLNLVLSVCIYTHAHTHMKKHSVCRVGTVVFSGLLWGSWNVSSADKMGMGLLYKHVASRQPKSRYNDSILKLVCSHLQHSYIFWLYLNVIVIYMTLNVVQYIPSVCFHSFPRCPILHVISSFMSPSDLVSHHFLMSLQAWHQLLYQINFIFTFF